MAEVFLARSAVAQGLAKLVVIKKIHPAFARSKHFLTMFVDEAKIALSLNHPNIVQVFDFGQVSGDCFLTMEYVEGLDVLRLMQSAQSLKKRIPYGLAAYVVQQMAKGLDYAHRKTDEYGEALSIVHRDVSPQNLLVSWDGAVKIVDFGIARARDVHEDEGVVKGKFAYMSPEQAAGRPVDRRSDIFSAGIVLYELATGKPLFSHLRGTAALEAVKSGAFARPREADPQLPADLEEIILKALAYHVDDRYQTARDMQQALLRFFYQVAIESDLAMDSGALAAFASQVVPMEQRKPVASQLASEGTMVPLGPPGTARGRPGAAAGRPQSRIDPTPAATAKATPGVVPRATPGGTPVARPAGTPAPTPAPTPSPRDGFIRSGTSVVPDSDPGRPPRRASGSGSAPALTPAPTPTPGRYGEDSSELHASGREVVLDLRERKHVLVVEGRIVGASSRSALADFLHIADDIAYKLDAFCDHIDDTGFTYLLGIPVAGEDDAGRAVRLARALEEAATGIARDHLSAPMALAIGVQRGLALVTRGSKDAFEYQLIGATASIARRLAAEAKPSEVLLGGGAYRVCRNEWNFDDLGEIDLPEDNETSPGGAALVGGLDDDGAPVRRAKVYRLRGPKDRLERMAGGPAPTTRIVGRELELRAIRDLYRQTIVSREAHHVLIVGDAGVGKRTLIAEFLRGIAGTDHVVVRARARSSASDIPYAVTADLARDVLGLGERVEPREIRQRLELSAELLWPGQTHSPEVRGVIDTFAILLGVEGGTQPGTDPRAGRADVDPGEWRHRVQRALRKLQERLANDRPLIVVIEDFHWADSQSWELFHDMVRDRARAPVFGLGTFRADERSDLLNRSAQLVIELGDLGPREREELVLARFGSTPGGTAPGDEEAAELAREILSKTGGNPLFIRECIESLLERGVLAPVPSQGTDSGAGAAAASAQPRLKWVKRDAPIQVPTSVEALVATRLDRLPPAEKEALAHASVWGPSFAATDVSVLLGRDAADALDKLTTRGLLEKVAPGPAGVPLEGAYRFRNEMTMEVAYGGLPAAARRELHRAAAERLQKSRAYRRGPDDAEIARHLALAGEAIAASRAFVTAGLYARDVSGAALALRHFTRALELLPAEAAHATQRFEIHAERETLLRALGRRPAQLREVHAMRKAATAAPPGPASDRMLAQALTRLARFYLEVGRAPQARRALVQALETARRAGDKLVESEALRLEAQLLKQIGRNAEALALCRQALALCGEDRPGLLQRGMILNSLGTVHMHMGQPREAIAAYAEALVIYRRLGVRRMEAATLNNMGIVSSSLGEFEEALAHYKRSLKIDQELGDRLALGIKLSNIGQCYLDLGDDDKAQRYLGKALSLAGQLGDSSGATDAMISLGQVHLKRGDTRASREMLEKGLAEAIAGRNRYQEIRALVYLAFCDVAPGGRAEGALEYARSAARLARDAVIPQGEVYAMAAEALALAQTGKVGDAVDRATAAVAVIDGGREVEGVEEIFHICGRMLREAGRLDEARRMIGRAYAEVRSKARRIRDTAWRGRYLGSLPARDIIQDHRALGGELAADLGHVLGQEVPGGGTPAGASPKSGPERS